MKNNQKQGRQFVVATVMILVILIMSIVGTTVAKYITTTPGGEHDAVVAGWHYTISETATDLFKTEYTNASVVTVKSLDADKVVAPGTSGSLTIQVKGYAETKAQVVVSVLDGVSTHDVALTDGEGNQYLPILWSLDINGANVVENASITDIVLQLTENAFALNLSAAGDNADTVVWTAVISWSWAFENTTNGGVNADFDMSYDALDTILGEGGAAGFTAVTDIALGFTVTVEQVNA